MSKLTMQLVAAIWLCGVAISPCVAIMYVWVSPTSGITHMTGTPPPWFRNPDYEGKVPRTLVFHNGKLIDQIGGEYGNADKPGWRTIYADLMAGEVAKQQPRIAPVRTARSPKVDEYDSGKYEGEAKTKRTRAADSVDHEKSPYTDQFGNPPTPGSWDAILDAKRKARQADARARAGYPVEDVPSPYTDQFGNTPRPGSWDAKLDAQWKANRAGARARGGEEEDGPQYRYKSITGRQYKYDLSKPLDRIRYRADAKAQIEDSIRNYVDPRAKIDEYVGQVGGGAK